MKSNKHFIALAVLTVCTSTFFSSCDKIKKLLGEVEHDTIYVGRGGDDSFETREDFLSSDLAAFGVRGHVQRISTSEGKGVAFNEAGKVISIRTNSNNYGKNIKRHRDRFASATFNGTWEDGNTTSIEYSYKGDKLYEISESGMTWNYTLRFEDYKDGLPHRVFIEFGEDGFMTEGWVDISYSDFDSHGNWITCRWHGTVKESDDCGESYSSTKYDETITREIFYY